MRIEIKLTFGRKRRRRPAMPISGPAYYRLMHELTSREPEIGGLLVGPEDNRLITHFVLDEAGTGATHSFALGHVWLNDQMIKFRAAGLDIKGFVHSHPTAQTRPSEGDRAYLRRLFNNPRNVTSELYFPIVCDGRLFPFIVRPQAIHSYRWATSAKVKLL